MVLLRYRIYIRFEIQASLEGLSEATRHRIVTAIERLGRDPFIEPDGWLTGEQGHSFAVRYVDDCAVLYRVDHAEKEVRIVDVVVA